MKKPSRTINCGIIELDGNRRVMLAKLDNGYYLRFETGQRVRRICLTPEALLALGSLIASRDQLPENPGVKAKE